MERAQVERRGAVEGVSGADEERAQAAAHRLGCEEVVEAGVGRPFPGADDGLDTSFERRVHRRRHARRVAFAAKLVHRLEHFEEGGGEPPRGQGAPSVGRGAVEQDVHRRHLLLPLVELGQRAEGGHVVRELAPRRLEGLLRLARDRASSSRGWRRPR